MSNNHNNLPMQQGSQSLSFADPRVIDTIRATVAKDASPQELEMFLHLCNQYQLDPFRKEIWFIKYKSNKGGSATPTIITSRDGYLKIAQQHPDYQGLMSQEVRENDYFEMQPDSGTVIHRFAQPISNRGQIVGAWATTYRKGFKPLSIFVNYSEYAGNSDIWRKYPSSMIIKVAEVFVLKRQFSITGLVTREELDSEIPGAAAPSFSQPIPDKQDPPVQVVPTNGELLAVQQQLGWTAEQLGSYIAMVQQKNGQQPKRWKDLDPSWKIDIYEMLQKRLQKMRGGE